MYVYFFIKCVKQDWICQHSDMQWCVQWWLYEIVQTWTFPRCKIVNVIRWNIELLFICLVKTTSALLSWLIYRNCTKFTDDVLFRYLWLHEFKIVRRLYEIESEFQILGIMEVWPNPKLASYFLFNSLVALIRHCQAQKCLQKTLNPYRLLKFPNWIFY